MTRLLDIQELNVRFSTPEGRLQAVDSVSYGVDAGESVAVVGESGSGKSVSALAIMGLVPQPPGQVSGKVLFEGQDLMSLDEESLREIRGARIGMIFQEPMTSLNPLLSIGTQLRESMELHLGLTPAQADSRAIDLLKMVGISEAQRRMKQYPHHLSGGMRQRVMIAIALSCEPRLLIADEPTTALDVTIQAQILVLMKDLTTRLGAALILITHNLGIVARYTSRVHVMYAGRVVESSDTRKIFTDPRHPYTKGLLASIPRMDKPRGERLVPIDGQPPDLTRLGAGCAYRPRCGFAVAACSQHAPGLDTIAPNRRSACFQSAHL
jgi:oligopeptide/dipeptide ABC transporter ATP-binding protein